MSHVATQSPARLGTLFVAGLLWAAASQALATPAAVTMVPGNSTSPVDLGSFAAGTYQLAASGIVDLAGTTDFQMRPDGTPAAPVTFPGYGYFNPDGSFTANGDFAFAGTNAKVGALVGTLNPAAAMGNNPSAAQQADWFLIGSGTTVILASAGHIYAAVNDTFASNNSGAFQVTVTAVPEPAQWALGLAGLVAIGSVLQRRRQG